MQAWGVMGVRTETLHLMGYELAAGRFLTPDDEYAALFGAFGEGNFMDPNVDWRFRQDRAWEMLMGAEDVEAFVDIFNDAIDLSYDQRLIWGGVDAEAMDIEEAFRPMTTIPLDVVGLLEPTGNWSLDLGLLMDIEVLISLNERAERARRDQDAEHGNFSAIQRGGERITYHNGMVIVESVDDTTRVAGMIQDMGFQVHYPGMFIGQLQEQQAGLQTMLAAIAAVSLFVAAIGIANTMIMAVYERTREIGIMKVIGAAITDVRRLFLLEAALIGFFGGAFGVLLSLIVSHLLNNTDINLMGAGAMFMGEGGQTSLITGWLCGVALAFSSLIGLVSGYFPARRATKLSALAAIRSE